MLRNSKKYSIFTSFDFLASLEAGAAFSEVTQLSFENLQSQILTPHLEDVFRKLGKFDCPLIKTNMF